MNVELCLVIFENRVRVMVGTMLQKMFWKASVLLCVCTRKHWIATKSFNHSGPNAITVSLRSKMQRSKCASTIRHTDTAMLSGGQICRLKIRLIFTTSHVNLSYAYFWTYMNLSCIRSFRSYTGSSFDSRQGRSNLASSIGPSTFFVFTHPPTNWAQWLSFTNKALGP